MPTNERRRDDPPSPAERNELVRRLVALGYKGQDLASIIRAGRTRQQIAETLVEVQRHAQRG